MPTPATAHWPRPRSEDEWEEMVLDALKVRWGDPDAQRNGRRGQRQHGVDIFGLPTLLKGKAGAQCKNTSKPTIEQLQSEVAKAEGFIPSLAKFYFVVAAKRDGAAFDTGFGTLTETCNACHQAEKVGFIRVAPPSVRASVVVAPVEGSP